MSNVDEANQAVAEEHSGGDAVFAGWQETGSGDAFALYTITAAGCPSRGSTVSDRTLTKMYLHAPMAPPLQSAVTGHTTFSGCGGCPVETRCIGPYHSRTGCSAFPIDEEEEEEDEEDEY
jgi:hypothetical protein